MNVDLNLIGNIVTIVIAIPSFVSWAIKGFSWRRSQKIRALEKQQTFFESLHNSDRVLMEFGLSSILSVLALLGIDIAMHAVGVDAAGKAMQAVSDSVIGFGIYGFALFRAVQIRRLKHFDKTMAEIQRELDKLKKP